jgi:hypothetical protein
LAAGAARAGNAAVVLHFGGAVWVDAPRLAPARENGGLAARARGAVKVVALIHVRIELAPVLARFIGHLAVVVVFMVSPMTIVMVTMPTTVYGFSPFGMVLCNGRRRRRRCRHGWGRDAAVASGTLSVVANPIRCFVLVMVAPAHAQSTLRRRRRRRSRAADAAATTGVPARTRVGHGGSLAAPIPALQTIGKTPARYGRGHTAQGWSLDESLTADAASALRVVAR